MPDSIERFLRPDDPDAYTPEGVELRQVLHGLLLTPAERLEALDRLVRAYRPLAEEARRRAGLPLHGRPHEWAVWESLGWRPEGDSEGH